MRNKLDDYIGCLFWIIALPLTIFSLYTYDKYDAPRRERIEKQRAAEIKAAHQPIVQQWKGHQYIKFPMSYYYRHGKYTVRDDAYSVVHDPDCPCHKQVAAEIEE